MRLILIFLLYNALIINETCFSQNSGANYVVIESDDTPQQIIKKAANIKPSKRQYEWQKYELTGFIHFGINTFEEVEWGHRGIDISKFNPTKIDVKQWVRVFKEAGFKLIILTAKHHDGFCLWPSKFTEFDIANTPFQNGKGDIVRDLSEACSSAGIKFGIYLSPWDMSEPSYGTESYNEHFRNQLTELLTNYGDIAEVWFDGANGEGPNGKRQFYDWQSYYQVIRKLQPNAVIAVSGPDVRWVGTESGYGRQSEWSVLPAMTMDQESIAAGSQQQAIDGAFVPRNLMDEDLGSREKLYKAGSLIWYPAEIDVSIRPGWFYHKNEDDLVKSPLKLVDIYYNSVGLNGVLLLNIPPDKNGLITDYDIKSLQGMRYILDQTFHNNLAKSGKVLASNERKGNEAHFILDDDLSTFWITNSGIDTATVIVELPQKQTINRAMLQENILVGQRIEKFHLEWWDGRQWHLLSEATTIGYKRLLRFKSVTTDKLKICIDSCRNSPSLASFGLYEAPPTVIFEPDGGTFADSVNFSLASDSPGATIFYLTDRTTADTNSLTYHGDVTIHQTSKVTTFAVSASGKTGLPMTRDFNKAKYNISLKSDYADKYSAGGPLALVDGVIGSMNFKDGRWQGYEGSDLEAVIDIGEERSLTRLAIRCLSSNKAYIFLPQTIEYSFSNDGKIYTNPIQIKNPLQKQGQKSYVHIFELKPQDTAARYVWLKVKNIGVCPDWHIGAGDKAWLFIDEIVVE